MMVAHNAAEFRTLDLDCAGVKAPATKCWTATDAGNLQEAVDRIFGTAGAEQLKSLKFSITLADPSLPTCPLIGCSEGFATLCGYEMEEIVGRNCKFLVDPVPKELVNHKVRRLAHQFCDAARTGEEFEPADADREAWMPAHQQASLFLVQTNQRKDGSLFDNMFCLKSIELDDEPYVVGLQTELPYGLVKKAQEPDDSEMKIFHQACELLDQNWDKVERVLCASFWYCGPMRRQDSELDQIADFDQFGRGPSPFGSASDEWSGSVNSGEVAGADFRVR